MNWRSRLTGTKEKPPIPISTEVRNNLEINKSLIPISTEVRNNLEINQALIPKPILTSMAGVLTWKATLWTLDQEHLTNLPEQWSNWSDTLEKRTVTAVSHPSWMKLWPTSPTQRCLPSLIWASSAQKQMDRWPTSRKRLSMRPSAKS